MSECYQQPDTNSLATFLVSADLTECTSLCLTVNGVPTASAAICRNTGREATVLSDFAPNMTNLPAPISEAANLLSSDQNKMLLAGLILAAIAAFGAFKLIKKWRYQASLNPSADIENNLKEEPKNAFIKNYKTDPPKLLRHLRLLSRYLLD